MKKSSEDGKYFENTADSHFFPDYFYIRRYFITKFESIYGKYTNISREEKEGNRSATKMEKDILIIAICIPSMEHVHSCNTLSGDIAFIDASGSMDRYWNQVFVVMYTSKIRGLSLGFIILEGSSEHEIEEGFMLWKSVFPHNAFYGLKEKGPISIMTDNSVWEKCSTSSVSTVWFGTVHIPCFASTLEIFVGW